ncbi:MAG: molybdopterin molybdotransferase MoeA [Anaeromyxobacteraceae bacterium]
MPSLPLARALVLENVRPLAAEAVPLAAGVGRVLAADLLAPWDHPAWDNSAMDGFAVRAADLAALPATLAVRGFVPAGRVPAGPLARGAAARIMTGAPVPEGADTIVPLEEAEAQGDFVLVRAPVRPGAHVRRAGEDLRAGGLALAAGTVLTPADVAVLAAFSRTEVEVVRRPHVAVLSTGDELLAPGEPRAPGRLYDMNSSALAAAVAEAGGVPVPLGVARDDRAATEALVAAGFTSDALVTSAGVWMGDRDHVRASLEAVGATQVFWKVEMKPGRPVAFWRRGDRPAFTLPGNPVAALLTFETFVRPALLRMGGHRHVDRPVVRALYQERLVAKPGRALVLRVRLALVNGAVHAFSAGKQEAGLIHPSLRADGLAILPDTGAELEPGSPIDVQLLRPDFVVR